MTTRILHITSTLGRNSDENRLGLLALRSPREEFDVHVCALTRGGLLADKLAQADIPTTVLGNRWKFDPWMFWQLRKHIAQWQPDILHTWTLEATAYAHAASRWCGNRRLIINHAWIGPGKTSLELGLDCALARRAHCVVVDSEAVRNDCVQHGLPAENMRVIPNGVEAVQPLDSTKKQVLEQLGLPENARLVAWIAPLTLQKRLKDAIWATDLLKVFRDDVHLLVIGEGPRHDACRLFRDKVLIRDKVHFLGNIADVQQLLPYCDVFWSTSESEGHSDAILEAMAAGLPVVATDIPGTRDLVLPNTTGHLVPVGDRAGFAKYTERILNDADMARRYGDAGRQRVAQDFNAQAMLDHHLELYRKVMRML
jgi:glycosyltransferase involved in cell wall biosynthesis